MCNQRIMTINVVAESLLQHENRNKKNLWRATRCNIMKFYKVVYHPLKCTFNLDESHCECHNLAIPCFWASGVVLCQNHLKKEEEEIWPRNFGIVSTLGLRSHTASDRYRFSTISLSPFHRFPIIDSELAEVIFHVVNLSLVHYTFVLPLRRV